MPQGSKKRPESVVSPRAATKEAGRGRWIASGIGQSSEFASGSHETDRPTCLLSGTGGAVIRRAGRWMSAPVQERRRAPGVKTDRWRKRLREDGAVRFALVRTGPTADSRGDATLARRS